jgi:hypothetical protein
MRGLLGVRPDRLRGRGLLGIADRDDARRFRQNASPDMATPEGEDFALAPSPSGGSSDRLSPAARQRFERMQKAAGAQRRDGESDAMALARWITDPRGLQSLACFLKHLQLAAQRARHLILMQIEDSTPSEYQRVFADIARERPAAIIVHARGELLRSRQLIVELVEKSRLPAIYPWREYVEAGGLMAYASDLSELGRRVADDLHEILNGANPGDIPIYLPTKYELVINLNAAKAIDLTLPPTLLATADEVIE